MRSPRACLPCLHRRGTFRQDGCSWRSSTNCSLSAGTLRWKQRLPAAPRAPRLVRLQREGYRFYLYFFWLPSPEMAIQCVAHRILSGGHDIPEPVIRRRYEAGLNNFFALYRPLANLWRIYDNTQPVEPALIAKGTLRVQQAALWEQIKKG